MNPSAPAVWFPTVRTGTGTDVFTERLAAALTRRGIRAEITWLPHRAEYAPWTVNVPSPPPWANVVHINSWLHRRFIPKGIPLAVTIHGCMHDPALEPYKSLPQKLYHRLWVKRCEAETIRRANAVTAVSHYTAKIANTVFGRKDIVTIHNWIDTSKFHPDNRHDPHHPFRLLFVGNLTKRKGADLLPEIMRRLGNDFELRYTGSPKDFPRPESLPANMIALGRLSGDKALVSTYHSCDALLFPTRLEGFGLVALEAQACGRPVVSTFGSSIPEVAEHHATGYLCPPGDVASYVRAARNLREEPIDWKRMSDAARSRAVQLYDELSIVNRWTEFYSRLVQGRADLKELA